MNAEQNSLDIFIFLENLFQKDMTSCHLKIFNILMMEFVKLKLPLSPRDVPVPVIMVFCSCVI